MPNGDRRLRFAHGYVVIIKEFGSYLGVVYRRGVVCWRDREWSDTMTQAKVRVFNEYFRKIPAG